MSLSTVQPAAPAQPLPRWLEPHEQFLADQFAKAAAADLSLPCTFAPPYLRGHGNGVTVGDVLFDAIDTTDFQRRAMQVLANAAAGRGTQRDAQQLLQEISRRWAFNNADLVL